MSDKDLIERVARASEEVERLSRELDITNADHIALWLEGNTIQDEPMSQCVSWLACRIVEAHERAIAAMQADAAPVAMVRVTNGGYAMSLAQYVAYSLPEGDHWLYTHPPVADRVSTSTPVDDRGSGNMSGKTDTAPVVKSDTAPVSDKLRPAVEVWEDAYGSYMLNEVGQDYEAAAAVIEQDREAVRAEQAAELAKFKALAETLAGALDDVWKEATAMRNSSKTVGHYHTDHKMNQTYHRTRYHAGKKIMEMLKPARQALKETPDAQ